MNHRLKRHMLNALMICFAVCLLTSQTAHSQITFNFIFDDVNNNTGTGFDDPTFGQSRRDTLIAVGDYLNTVFDENGTIDITVDNSQSDGGGSLASASPSFFSGPNGFSNGLAFENATNGTDLSAGTDATLSFDFGFNFNSELDAPTGGEFDLFSVALHEVNHVLGFISALNSSGNSALSSGNPGAFTVFDSFLQRGDGTALFGPGGEFLGTPGDLTSGDVFFSGANAVAANGGNLVEIFAPGSFNFGTSLSHLDGSAFPTAVSQPATTPGATRRELLEVEIGLFQDLGFDILPVAVPEPSTMGLVLFGCAGFFLRRKK